MSLSEALPGHLAMKEMTGYEVRKKDEDTLPERIVDRTAGGEESIPQRGTNGCKGSQLSHRGPDMGIKGQLQEILL